MQCACAILLLTPVACPALHYFSTLSHKRHDFRKKKKLLSIKCVLIFYTYFVWKISHSKKNLARYAQKCLQHPTFLSDFDETRIFWTDFRKCSNIKFHENPSSGIRVPCGQVDRRTDKLQLIFACRNFANARYNKCIKLLWISNLTQFTGEIQNFV